MYVCNCQYWVDRHFSKNCHMEPFAPLVKILSRNTVQRVSIEIFSANVVSLSPQIMIFLQIWPKTAFHKGFLCYRMSKSISSAKVQVSQPPLLFLWKQQNTYISMKFGSIIDKNWVKCRSGVGVIFVISTPKTTGNNVKLDCEIWVQNWLTLCEVKVRRD